jgi:septum formation protein
MPAARLRVLRAAGIDPEVRVSGVDETARERDAAAAALDLACRKARAVADKLDGADPAVVLGCDSMLAFEGELLGKPRDDDEIRAWWRRRAGQDGELLTGHCVIVVHNGERREVSGVGRSTVHFGTPSEREVDAYIASGEPQRVAGAFTIEGRGGWFVRGVTGDVTNVLGLSLPLLRDLLARLDIAVTDRWSPPVR